MAISVDLGLVNLVIGGDAGFVDLSTPDAGEFAQTGTANDDVHLQLLFGSTSYDAGAGNDSVTDVLTIITADNLFFGNAGNDTLSGGIGNDTLIGGAGDDNLNGGVGNDMIVYDFQGTDILDGGSNVLITGADTLYLTGTNLAAGLTFTFSAAGSFANGTTWTNFEQLAFFGSAFADDITGSALDDALEGAGGMDTLRGGAGNDVLLGGDGADTLESGEGDDFLSGENQADTLIVTGNGTKTVDGGSGADTLRVLWGDGSQGIVVNITGANTGTVDQGAGRSITFGGVERLDITGTSFDDTLRGSTANDLLYGVDGNDLIEGGAGNDVLGGGSGTNTVSGGLGDDTYYVVVGGSDTIVEGIDEGYDRVYSQVDLTLAANVERGDLTDAAVSLTGNDLFNLLVGTGFANTIRGKGGNDRVFGRGGDDTIYGDNGNDTIYGENGFDTLYGGTGHDKLYGGLAVDALSGGEGDDLIVGGEGRDNLKGGLGADTFVWESLLDFGGKVISQADRIMDFVGADGDKIDLSAIDANTNSLGDDAFSFIGGAAFSGAAGELRAKTISDGNTYIYGDLDGDKAQDFVIRVDGAVSLNAGNFFL